MNRIKDIKINPITKILLKTGLESYFLGSFLAGIILCKSCEKGLIENIFVRIFIGIVSMILSSFSFGFPPRDAGGVGEPYNLWPYIISCWIIIFLSVILCKINIKNSSKH